MEDLNKEDHLPKTQLHHAIKSGHKDVIEQLLAKGAVVNKTYISKSPLHYAVESQYVHVIELLLALGANINITDVYTRTPLQYAVQSESKDIIKLLLAQGADTNISDVCKNTALHYAVLSENKDIVEQLLTHGAKVNVNYSGVSKSPLHYAIELQHTDLVELLLAHGADTNVTDLSNNAPLYYAVVSENKSLVKLLLTHGADMNITDLSNNPPLHYAVLSKNKDIVELLLTHGAKVNLNYSRVCKSPLNCAIESQHKDIVELLLAHDANVNETDKYDKTPLFHAIKSHKDIVELLLVRGANINKIDRCNKTPLFYAIESRNKDIIELLIARGANINISDLLSYIPFGNLAELRNDDIGSLLMQGFNFNTNVECNRAALHYASRLGRNDIVQMLLTQGANVNSKNKYGKVPIYYAIKWRRKDIVELLLAHGAKLNITDKDGDTPLHCAVRSGSKDIVKLLLTHGTKVNITDGYHRTLLYYASAAGYKDIVELLLHHRNNPNLKSNGDTALSIAAQRGKTVVVKYMINNKDLYKILVNKVPIMKYYIGKPKMEKFLFSNGVIPEPEKHSKARIMQTLTRGGQGVHNSYEIRRIKFFVKKLKDVQQNYCIDKINKKILELSQEFKALSSCKNVELLSFTESEKRNLLTPLRDYGNKNYYDYMMNCTPQQFIESIILQTVNTLNNWLQRKKRGLYTCPKSIQPLEYDSNDDKGKITIPELLGRLRLLIDEEPNLVEKRELCATFFEKNADFVTAKLAKIQVLHPKFTSDQVTKKSLVHELLSFLDDGQVSKLYTLVSNENINETLKEQKLFALAKGIYGTSIIYGHNQEGCLVGTFHHLVNVIEEISYNFSDEYQDYLDEQLNVNRKEIDESNIRNLVRSVAKNILETVDNMSEAIQNMLQDHIIHITPITSVLSNPSHMTFEQQKLFVVINENILDKLLEVVPDYGRVFPTNHELKLIVDNLYTDQLFQKWTDKPEELVENISSKRRKKETN